MSSCVAATHAASNSSSTSSSKANTSKKQSQEQPHQLYPEVFAAYAATNAYRLTDRADLIEQFDKTCHVVKTSTGRLPFSDPTNPGAFIEYEEWLERLDQVQAPLCHKKIRQPRLPLDDPRLQGCEEALRYAAWLAHAPRRGFAALGRPPELQQLVASTCLDLYSRHAVSRDHTHEDSSHLAQLWSRLCPQLRINVLADVAVGLLCDSEPLPPDTLQHGSALLAILYAGYGRLLNEISGRDLNKASKLLRGLEVSPHTPRVTRPKHVHSIGAIHQCVTQRDAPLHNTRALLTAPLPASLLGMLHGLVDAMGRDSTQESDQQQQRRQQKHWWSFLDGSGTTPESEQQQQQQPEEGVLVPQMMGLLLQGAAMAQAAAGRQAGAVWATYQQALPDAVRLLQLEEPLAQGAATVEQMGEWLAAALAVVGPEEGVAAGSDVGPLVHRVLDALVPELAPVLGQQAAAAASTTSSSSGGPRYASGTLLGRLRLRGLVLGWHLAWGAAAAAWRWYEARSQQLAEGGDGDKENAGSSSSSSSSSSTADAAADAAVDCLVVQMVLVLQAAEGLLHTSVQCHQSLVAGLPPLLRSPEVRAYLAQLKAGEASPGAASSTRTKAANAATSLPAAATPSSSTAAAEAGGSVQELLAHLAGTPELETVLQLLMDLLLPERGHLYQQVQGVAAACLQPVLTRVEAFQTLLQQLQAADALHAADIALRSPSDDAGDAGDAGYRLDSPEYGAALFKALSVRLGCAEGIPGYMSSSIIQEAAADLSGVHQAASISSSSWQYGAGSSQPSGTGPRPEQQYSLPGRWPQGLAVQMQLILQGMTHAVVMKHALRAGTQLSQVLQQRIDQLAALYSRLRQQGPAEQGRQLEGPQADGDATNHSTSSRSRSRSPLEQEDLEHARRLLVSIDTLAQLVRPHVGALNHMFTAAVHNVEGIMEACPPTSAAGFVRVPWEALSPLPPEERHRVTGDGQGAAGIAARAHNLCEQGRVVAAVTLLVEATVEGLGTFGSMPRLLDLSAERLLEASYLPWLAGWEAYGRQQHHLCRARTAAINRQRFKAQLATTKDAALQSKLEAAADKQLKRQLHHLRQLQGLLTGPSAGARRRLDGDWRRAANTNHLLRQQGRSLHAQSSSSDEEDADGEGGWSEGGSSRDMSPGELSTPSDTSGDEDSSSRASRASKKGRDMERAVRRVFWSGLDSTRAQKRRERRREMRLFDVEDPKDKRARREEAATQLLAELLEHMQLPPPQEPSQQQAAPQAGTPAAAAAAAVAAKAARAAQSIDWSAWVPWFNPGCPLCVQEVQDLMAEQQQQQQGAAAGGARGEVPLRCRPGYHPWTAEAATTAAAAAAAAGGENGHAHPDHPSNDTSSSSSSPGGPWLSSCYGSWPVPWSCAFRYRRLLWRLLARLKPRAAAFYAQQAGMCAHVSGTHLWEKVLQSLLEVLYVPVGASGDLLVLRPPLGSQHSPAADQHADALNQGYVEALAKQPSLPLQPLLSAQVLLALGAGQPSAIPSDKHAGDADVLFQPGALQGAAGHCLLEQALGSSGLQQLLLNEYGLTLDPAWVVNWHIGVRQQGLQAFLAQQQAQGSSSSASSGSSSDEALRAALLAAYNSADARVAAVGYASRQWASRSAAAPLGDATRAATRGLLARGTCSSADFGPGKNASFHDNLTVSPYNLMMPVNVWLTSRRNVGSPHVDNNLAALEQLRRNKKIYGREPPFLLCCRNPDCEHVLEEDVWRCSSCGVHYCSQRCRAAMRDSHDAVCGNLTAAAVSAGSCRAGQLLTPSEPWWHGGDGLAFKQLVPHPSQPAANSSSSSSSGSSSGGMLSGEEVPQGLVPVPLWIQLRSPLEWLKARQERGTEAMYARAGNKVRRVGPRGEGIMILET